MKTIYVKAFYPSASLEAEVMSISSYSEKGNTAVYLSSGTISCSSHHEMPTSKSNCTKKEFQTALSNVIKRHCKSAGIKITIDEKK